MNDEECDRLILYGYWRSSASYRVRIALHLKGLEFEYRPVHLVRDGGEQHTAAYRQLNPLGLVPALLHRERVMVQSMAICEYLDETFASPALLPPDAAGRARVRSLAQSIASEIQPLNNLAVMQYLKKEMNQPDEAINQWLAHWVVRGFTAIETWLKSGPAGRFCHGDTPGLADCFLVPQVYNAERFACDLTPYPIIRGIAGQCRKLVAFQRAAPEQQADAPTEPDPAPART